MENGSVDRSHHWGAGGWLLPALLAGCAARAPAVGPELPEAAPPRVVEGPWEEGSYLAIIGDEAGGAHAAWLEDGALRYAHAAAGGGWGPSEPVAGAVEAGDGGQIRPSLALTPGGPVLAFAVDGRPQLATRGRDGWTHQGLSTAEGGVGSLLDLAVVDGEPLVVWLDTRRDPEAWISDVYAWYRGGEERVYTDGGDGVCVCCRPAAGRVDGHPAVAFRDADGELREVRLMVRGEDGWLDRGQVTSGGWAPGGCPSDGPVFDGEALLVSDARDGGRRIYRGDVALPVPDGIHALQPRAAGGRDFWLQASEGSVSLVSDDAVLVTTSGRLEPGDPALVGEEIWIPWEDGAAHVVAVHP